MQAIQPLWQEMPLHLRGVTEKTGASFPRSFSEVFQAALDSARPTAPSSLPDVKPVTDIFRSAAEAVRETDAERVRMEYLLATGQLDNPALATIAAAKAQSAVDLMVQLRNRALDAYNELMRISL